MLNATQGGAIVSVLELVKASRAAGTDVEHYAVYPGVVGREDPSIHSAFHGARIIPIPTWNRPTRLDLVRRAISQARSAKATFFGLRSRRGISKAIRDWDIDLVTTNCSANIHGALVARSMGLPHVWHIRERIGSLGSMHFGMSDRILVQKIRGLSSIVATVSGYVAEPFREHGADDRLEVVYDGVDVEAFACPEAKERGRSLRRSWGVSEDSTLVGKVANVTSQGKGHELFLRAAAKVRSAHENVFFVAVGLIPRESGWVGKPAWRRWLRLKEMARESGVEDRIIWAGVVDDPPAVMNAIDILGHACDFEGFPRVIMEAMAAGKPVVGPAAGGVAEGVVSESTGFLVQPGSPDALAAGIGDLVNDVPRRQRLGDHGKERVGSQFTMAGHAITMAEIYDRARG